MSRRHVESRVRLAANLLESRGGVPARVPPITIVARSEPTGARPHPSNCQAAPIAATLMDHGVASSAQHLPGHDLRLRVGAGDRFHGQGPVHVGEGQGRDREGAACAPLQGGHVPAGVHPAAPRDHLTDRPLPGPRRGQERRLSGRSMARSAAPSASGRTSRSPSAWASGASPGSSRTSRCPSTRSASRWAGSRCWWAGEPPFTLHQPSAAANRADGVVGDHRLQLGLPVRRGRRGRIAGRFMCPPAGPVVFGEVLRLRVDVLPADDLTADDALVLPAGDCSDPLNMVEAHRHPRVLIWAVDSAT